MIAATGGTRAELIPVIAQEKIKFSTQRHRLAQVFKSFLGTSVTMVGAHVLLL
jgi:hypothetical protein